MYYKQKNSGGKLITIGETLDGAILPKGFSQISKKEYDRFMRVFSIELDEPKLTPLNEKGELLFFVEGE